VEHEGDFQVEPIRILQQKVLKMQHGTMNKLCGRNTHNCFSILKKTKAKMQDSILGSKSFRTTSQNYWLPIWIALIKKYGVARWIEGSEGGTFLA
jgi:hypothetical protein